MIEVPIWGIVILHALLLVFGVSTIIYSWAYHRLKELFLFADDQHTFQKEMAEKWKAKYYVLRTKIYGEKDNGENA